MNIYHWVKVRREFQTALQEGNSKASVLPTQGSQNLAEHLPTSWMVAVNERFDHTKSVGFHRPSNMNDGGVKPV